MRIQNIRHIATAINTAINCKGISPKMMIRILLLMPPLSSPLTPFTPALLFWPQVSRGRSLQACCSWGPGTSLRDGLHHLWEKWKLFTRNSHIQRLARAPLIWGVATQLRTFCFDARKTRSTLSTELSQLQHTSSNVRKLSARAPLQASSKRCTVVIKGINLK